MIKVYNAIEHEYELAPVASIIIVTYNRPENLRSAIQSIFNQTLKNWELLILDYTENESVNATVREWATQDIRVRWVWHSENINNIARCWNEGLKIIKGKYWCTLDDDNKKYPEYLEKMTKFLEKNPENDAVVCPMDNTDINGNKIDVLFWKPVSFDDLLHFNKMDSGQIVHRKTNIEKVGLFDESLTSHEDWDYNLRIFKLNDKSGSAFGWLNSMPLCSYTKHEQQRSLDPTIIEKREQTFSIIRAKNN
jgi:GT2 family glycosyltransferase